MTDFDEDEDIDQLIDDLESVDGDAGAERSMDEEDGTHAVDDKWLNTDAGHGLTETEVEERRKIFGRNEMKEEKTNHVIKFLSYFVGPIQFVMEVCLMI